jgi:periplasmic divalent cation tolerance protein
VTVSIANVTGYLQVSTTADSREAAARLAQSAVEAGLAAGAQVTGPVVSYFWHLGQLGEGEEYQVTLKTTEARYPDLEAHLIREHPWDNPEVTAVEIAAGSATYLEWLDRTTSAQESS